MRRTAESRESGFTLIELLVTIMFFGIIVGIAVAPYRNYQRAQAHAGTTRLVVASLRSAQVNAVAENATYRVTFAADGKSWQVQRMTTTSSWANIGPVVRSTDPQVAVRDEAFRQADGSLGPDVVFYPRGSASKGSLVVGREGRGKVYTVTVEGLTARVSYS